MSTRRHLLIEREDAVAAMHTCSGDDDDDDDKREPTTSDVKCHPDGFTVLGDVVGNAVGDVNAASPSCVDALMTDELSEPKHSSGDLQSRLKTRKVLGVGERDIGDVHRSKISQILGHSEHLYSKLPKGLCWWQILEAVSYVLLAFVAIFLPGRLYSWSLGCQMIPESALGVRFYGAALACMAVLLWQVIGSVDKALLRLALLVSSVHYGVQVLVMLLHIMDAASTLRVLLAVLVRAVQMATNVHFWQTMYRPQRTEHKFD